jgi:hypothetical protein
MGPTDSQSRCDFDLLDWIGELGPFLERGHSKVIEQEMSRRIPSDPKRQFLC